MLRVKIKGIQGIFLLYRCTPNVCVVLPSKLEENERIRI